MIRSKSPLESPKEHGRAIDFDLPWHSQLDGGRKTRKERAQSPDLSALFPAIDLFSQFDRRFDVQRQAKRRSRPPFPIDFLSAAFDTMARNEVISGSSFDQGEKTRQVNKCRSVSDLGGQNASSQVQMAIRLAQRYREQRENGEEKGRDARGIVQTSNIQPSHHDHRPLGQARSLTGLSTRYNEQEGGPRQSPLRQRRCQPPLSIKTPTELRMSSHSKRARAATTSIHSPPPCPPPCTPLPSLPPSTTSIRRPGDDWMNAAGGSKPRVRKSCGRASTTSWDWNQAVEPDSATSSSTSPASSKGFSSCSSSSSHHHHHHRSSSKSHPRTPPSLIEGASPHQPQLWRWDEKAELSLAFHLHLDSTSESDTKTLRHASHCHYPTEEEEEQGDGDDYHVYGMAL